MPLTLLVSFLLLFTRHEFWLSPSRRCGLQFQYVVIYLGYEWFLVESRVEIVCVEELILLLGEDSYECSV